MTEKRAGRARPLKKYAVAALRALPLLLIAAAAVVLLRGGRLSAQAVLSYTPRQPLLAALALLLMYAVKSLSVVFPVAALLVAGGLVFSLPAALFVNLLGVAVTLTVPYWTARYTGGGGRLRRWVEKNDKLLRLKAERPVFLAYLLRIVAVLPGDAVSMYLGSSGMGFWKYLLGSLLGFLPGLVTVTLLGGGLSELSGTPFWTALGVNIGIIAASVAAYFKLS